MRLSSAGLGLKLNLALLAFLLILGISTAGLILYGFDRTQKNATAASEKDLQDFSIQVIYAFVRLVSTTHALELAKASDDATFAARYIVEAKQSGTPGSQPPRLVAGEGGALYDPSPGRPADVWVPAPLASDTRAASRLQDAAALDGLLPALLKTVPEGIGAYSVAYFLGAGGETRRYPPSSPAQPQSTVDPWSVPGFAAARPDANPKRQAVWTPPYQHATRGWLMSVLAPVYFADEFVGCMVFDIPLASFVADISGTHPTNDGYAFYVDRSGALLQTNHSQDVTEALNVPRNEALVKALAAMRAGEKGFTRAHMAGVEVFVAYAPVDGLGGSMGFVAPVDAMLAEIQAFKTSDLIAAEGGRTVRLTLAAMGGLFVFALVAATYLNRRVLLRPLEAMAAGTRAVAAGDLTTVIPVSGDDELATLARSFNEMTSEIRERRDSLERQVEERTRELTTLLQISHDVASTLELRPLLQLLVEQIKTVIDYWRARLFLVEGDALFQVAAPDAPEQARSGQRALEPRPLRMADLEPMWSQLTSGHPVIIDDVRDDSEMARVWQRSTADRPEAVSLTQSFLAVPLALKDLTLGMLTLSHPQKAYYGPEQARLLLAIASQVAVAVENARLYEQAGKLAAAEERQRLARELHDSVSQALYGIALSATAARTLLDQDPARAAVPVDYVMTLADAAMAEMRALIFELRPESLEQEGLIVAIEKQVAATAARHGIAVRADLGEEPEIPLPAKEVLYRVCQEALHNVVKHSQATQASVHLSRSNGSLVLEISDNGVGFDSSQKFPGHIGLVSMSERAATIGGRLEISSTPNQGTKVQVSTPLAPR